jgi:uncharacterized protein
VGCRHRAAATELVRLVIVAGGLCPGPRGRRSGRGASIHPREACIMAAIKAGALTRALRAPLGLPRVGRGATDQDAELVRRLVKDIQIAYEMQHLRAGRTT